MLSGFEKDVALLNFYKGNTTKPFMLGKGGSGRGHICSLIIYDYYHVTRPSKQMNPYYNARVELHQRVVEMR